MTDPLGSGVDLVYNPSPTLVLSRAPAAVGGAIESDHRRMREGAGTRRGQWARRTPVYEKLIDQLRSAYDLKAEERDGYEIASWKVEERDWFLSLLQREQKQSLLEIGSGPGQFGRFFQDKGLDVICTDLSSEMVRLCREKGLTAYEMDFLNLYYPDRSFDAVFALNCLLHVPTSDLPRVLGTIQALLNPGGLFYMGVYGGREYEGIWPDDRYEPKRFFSFHTDEWIQQTVTEFFELLHFRPITLEGEQDFHFQSMILRKE
jgi:SAM-dependent methyltransferase